MLAELCLPDRTKTLSTVTPLTCWDIRDLSTDSRHPLAGPPLLLLLGPKPTAWLLLRELHVADDTLRC